MPTEPISREHTAVSVRLIGTSNGEPIPDFVVPDCRADRVADAIDERLAFGEPTITTLHAVYPVGQVTSAADGRLIAALTLDTAAAS